MAILDRPSRFICLPFLHCIPQRLFHTGRTRQTGMGYAIPMAIAVATANPGREVIAVDGDGGFMFNIQELETIRRLQLPIKFFVLNNDGYASIRASQKAYFGESKLGSDKSNGLTVPHLTQVGAAFGLGSAVIKNQENLRADVRRVLEMKGPVVCDVNVVPDEMRAPRLQSYQKADGSFVSKPLEDLFPFLPRAEFLANMIVEPLPE